MQFKNFFFNYQVELLLQLFVGVIDTELFKTVDFKRFKSVDIQDSNELVSFATRSKSFVHLQDNPVKEEGVNAFCKGITSKQSLKNTKITFKFKLLTKLQELRDSKDILINCKLRAYK